MAYWGLALPEGGPNAPLEMWRIGIEEVWRLYTEKQAVFHLRMRTPWSSTESDGKHKN